MRVRCHHYEFFATTRSKQDDGCELFPAEFCGVTLSRNGHAHEGTNGSKGLILVPRGCDPSWPAPWIETSGRLQFSVRDSRTSDLSAQSRAFIKMVDQAINFGQEIQNFSDITLKEKQYEVLKLLVVEEKDVLAVLPTGYGKSLIYYLLPPV